MKTTIQSVFIAGFAIALTFTSCKKDEATATGTAPTVSLVDSLGSNKFDKNNFFVFPTIVVTVAPASGTTIDSFKVELSINGTVIGLSEYDAAEANQVNGFTESYPVLDITGELSLPLNSTIKFTASAKDNKGLVGTSTFTYTVVNDKAVLVSTQIELGAQANTAIPYKFLGVNSSFATYTPGADGTARANSANIDFVYYYGVNDQNAFAAPTNVDGAKVIWNNEINTWGRQNATKFKTTSITSAQFDDIASTTKVDDLFAAEAFTTGTTDKVTSVTVGSVYAFQTARGVKGLAKFTAVADANTGSTKVILIIQN
jgi:hypothetical protein